MAAYTTPSLPPSLQLIASGKVRDLYSLTPTTLLFIATDRISAYDVILSNGIPGKGKLLTQITAHWIEILTSSIPGLKTHLVSLDLPPQITSLPDPTISQALHGRSMVVGRHRIFPIEAIVRGYITGSAWSEYKKSGTVNGKPQPSGLQESEKFPQPIYTPSTKAELGEKDENITTEQAAAIVGTKYAARIEQLALQLYESAHAYALKRGIIIADTKFEFGVPLDTPEGVDGAGDVVLVDEVLTPDSSRFWPKDKYEVGRGQESFDKQYLRNWLTENELKGKDGVGMPEEVVRETGKKYKEAFALLTGKEFKA
ncbi:putative phosphoribosyl-aminoimidazole-succinocarboxamide synthase [Phaeomoniella chlamydospora]|uniref:Phosphoribosylaminoimidazole-succinocarboxamide synthase n=1 Tax=Phaeomoniella chlamydospora TaxID=158046 RepID=A0A0G2GPU6_PHACM|nr:putative phosphoribosyl-aminoimidazole-succinocarboxamide synthase [Phaeomoniella chlamydospora]